MGTVKAKKQQIWTKKHELKTHKAPQTRVLLMQQSSVKKAPQNDPMQLEKEQNMQDL